MKFKHIYLAILVMTLMSCSEQSDIGKPDLVVGNISSACVMDSECASGMCLSAKCVECRDTDPEDSQLLGGELFRASSADFEWFYMDGTRRVDIPQTQPIRDMCLSPTSVMEYHCDGKVTMTEKPCPLNPVNRDIPLVCSGHGIAGQDWPALCRPLTDATTPPENTSPSPPETTSPPPTIQVAPSASCADSDGNDTLIRGTVTGVTADAVAYTYGDYCDSSNEQMCEWTCNGTDKQVQCNSCQTDYHCDAGACVSGAPAPASCTDSDEGDDKFTRGYVTGITRGGEAYIEDDFCFGYDGQLCEYTCNGTIKNVQCDFCPMDYHCDAGACVSGAPAQASCMDSDGGDNRSTLGTVTGVTRGGLSYTDDDFCYDWELCEFTCNGTERELQCNPCQTNYHCYSGACVADAASCTDTDGNDIYTLGTVTGITQGGVSYSHDDHCDITNGKVCEYTCDGTEQRIQCNYCQDGYICNSGVCVLNSQPMQASCTDTDGNDIFTLGTVEGTTPGGISYTYDDVCSTFDGRICEWTCNGNEYRFQCIFCPADFHCDAGMCVAGAPAPATCTDTDGSDTTTLGTVTGVTQGGESYSYDDYCDPSNGRMCEWTCNGTTQGVQCIYCTGDLHCADGKCM